MNNITNSFLTFFKKLSLFATERLGFISLLLPISFSFKIANSNILSNYLSTTPNDYCYSNQWAIEKVELDKAWDVYTGSSQVSVGVIDSGIDGEHEDLTDNINTTISTQFGNYFNTGLEDSVSHGTHVAGIIGAVGNNSIGVSGACWDIDLVSLRIANYSGSTIYIPGIAEAITYASSQNHFIPILNASLGFRMQFLYDYNYDILEIAGDLSTAFNNYNGLVVAAAGNNNKDIDSINNFAYPASCSYSNMIVVGNSDEDDERYIDTVNSGIFNQSSNYGETNVDLFAPGVNIYSTIPDDDYTSYTGTSMATPLVTGTIALLKSIDPTLTVSELKTAILDNVDIVSNLDGLCATGGRLNAYNAVLSILSDISPNSGTTTFVSNPSYPKFMKINCNLGHYTINVSSNSSIRIKVYSKYTASPLVQRTFSAGNNSFQFICNTAKTYYVQVENLSNSSDNVSIYSNYDSHDYTDSYVYYNQNYHRSYCECGNYVLQQHLFPLIPGINNGYCLLCQANVYSDNIDNLLVANGYNDIVECF